MSSHDYRFEAIECQNPYDVPLEEWQQLQPLKWILINSVPLYDQMKEIPSFDQYQQSVLNKTLTYSRALNVKKVHLVMSDIDQESDR